MKVWREGSQGLVGAVRRHLAGHPPTSTEGWAGSEKVASERKHSTQCWKIFSPDSRLKGEKDDDVSDEGVAAPLRHPDSDPLTQITASPGPPLTAPPPLLGSLRGTTTATRSPPLPLGPHYPPCPPYNPHALFEDI